MSSSGITAASSGDNRSAAQWPPQSPGQRPYPEMPKMADDKPILTSLGASGVAIFSGIITSEEYNPDFFWRDGIRIYEQMLRSDGQIRAIRQVVEHPIKRATWSIEPGSESPRDKEIASFVETCLFHDMTYTTADGRVRRQSWAQIVHHILMHLWYGFMTFEIDYRIDDGWVKWAKWEPLLPRTIWRWWVGRDTELVGVQQWTFKNWNYAFTDIPADKLLLFVHQQEGANYEGLSLLRTAYKHWWYKQNLEKIAAIGIERNAVVPPVITLPPNFTSADIAAAQTLGANMRASELGYATLPPGWMLDYPAHMQPFTADVMPLLQHHDLLIARNVLAQFVNLGAGSETGAYALADAQQEMFLQALEAITDYICDTINADAIQRLVDYNYDNVAVYPRLRAAKLANADITALADAIGKLKAREANFLTPDPEMEDYLREQFGFPKAPKSVIQSMNPTAENDPARPDNANAADHTTQQSVSQSPKPQQAQVAQQAQVTAANNAIAPSAPGDGGALSEALGADVRLLREAVASIAQLDAVERGMVFFNPNHDPHSGEFTTGGGGAGGSGDGGRAAKGGSSRGGGRSRSGGGSASGGSKAKAEKGEAKPRASRAAKATDAKPAEEDIHARAARLQREGGLKAEVKPGSELEVALGGGEAAGRYEGSKIGYDNARTGLALKPYTAEHTEYTRLLYGEQQLGAALSRHSAETLREKAAAHGLPTSGTKATLVSRITAHATGGRYSANFGAKSGGGKRSPAEIHAAKAAKLKAALDKAQAAYDAHMANAPKLSEQSAHARTAARLLAEVERLTAALREAQS